MKRMLMVASVPSMIGQFNMGNINILLSLGYHVDVACDWNDRSVWNDDKVEDLKNKLKQINVDIYQVDFSRNIIKINRHIKSCIQLINLIKKKKYITKPMYSRTLLYSIVNVTVEICYDECRGDSNEE